MAHEPERGLKMSSTVLSKSIPVQQTSTLDDSFSLMKEKFSNDMKRMDQEMTKFSTDLNTMYGTSSNVSTWDELTRSPLVEGEGDDMVLKLQFDVSQFDPSEIKVTVMKDRLTIYANHEQKTDTSFVSREFKREFLLPKGTDPESVNSFLSRDGVLTVLTPLHLLKVQDKIDENSEQVETVEKIESGLKSGTTVKSASDEKSGSAEKSEKVEKGGKGKKGGSKKSSAK